MLTIFHTGDTHDTSSSYGYTLGNLLVTSKESQKMNAFSLLRKTEYIGAKELRVNLDRVLKANHPYRVMLHNRPTVTIIPDDKFLEILEIMEALKDSGLFKNVVKQFNSESKKKNPWFWSKAWQNEESQVERQIKKGKIKTAYSAKDLIKRLEK